MRTSPVPGIVVYGLREREREREREYSSKNKNK
jgi:hypothetical protein